MTWLDVFILSLVQGLTEFLPISSSGHLVIFQSLLGFQEPPVVLDVMLHVGTLLAVFVYFWSDLVKILVGLTKNDKVSWRLVLLVILGTIPAVIAGGLWEKQIEASFSSLKVNGGLFLVTGGLLLSTRFFQNTKKPLPSASWLDALVIGLMQAVAILPAISRSGATIVAGLWRGLDREAAFRYSFYLAIPAIFGALVLQLPKLAHSSVENLELYAVGTLISGLVGFFSLKLLESVLKSSKFYLFGIYCLLLGLILLFI